MIAERKTLPFFHPPRLPLVSSSEVQRFHGLPPIYQILFHSSLLFLPVLVTLHLYPYSQVVAYRCRLRCQW
uniref:Uncharacterized protein n=1 Tax=Dulem virus 40 TaxID=3145758 RepID=A0AAU8AWF4_9CAUD